MLHPALLYRRVSTDDQSHSLAAQESKLAQYCQLADLDPIGEFEDEDVSGRTPMADRPGGSELIAALKAGRASHLVVAKLDRLGRSAVDVLQTIDQLRMMNVTVHIVDLRVDCSTPQGRFMLQLLAAVSELEVAMIRERITTTLADRRARGFVVGKIPYGWQAAEVGVEGHDHDSHQRKGGKKRRVQRILVDDPVQQQWLQQMILWRWPRPPFNTITPSDASPFGYLVKPGCGSGLGWHRIATCLNEQGCVARTAPGAGVTHNSSGLWTKSMVESVLTNKYTLEFAERIFGTKAS